MPRDALFSMQYLIPLLYENNVKYRIILSSDFKWETYKNFNMIFIGAFKNLKALSILTDKLNVKYDNDDFSITLDNGKRARTYTSMFLSGKNIDYTLVSKLPGTNDNVIYLFISDNDIGCIEAVRRFTEADSIKSFEKNILKDADYFRALYIGEGINRTSVTFNLIDFMPIRDSALVNFWHY